MLRTVAATLLIGSTLAATHVQAGWVKGAKYAYNILDGIGTWSFYAELLENDIFLQHQCLAFRAIAVDIFQE